MKRQLAALVALTALTACSPRTIALRQTAAILSRGAPALYEEPDPQLARESFGSQLLLIEALLRNEPTNPSLLKLAAEGFGGYAFLFFEDSAPQRARGFYLRGRDFALRLLARRKPLAGLLAADPRQTGAILAKCREGDVPGLFWAAFDWAGYIDLSKDSPDALADLPKAAALMARARALDPDYHFAGPELFFGVYYASRPRMLGGDPQKARAEFEDARRRTHEEYLMAYVLEARYAAVALQDRALFTGLLRQVLAAPAGRLPNARLTDEVAKLEAKNLLERTDDFF